MKSWIRLRVRSVLFMIAVLISILAADSAAWAQGYPYDFPYGSGRTRDATAGPGILVGLGLGGGRVQDKVTGYAGYALDASVGFSPMRNVAVVADLDGLLHSFSDGSSLIDGGAALSVEGRVADRVRLSLGGGYYWLTHTASTAPNSSGTTTTLQSPGLEAGLGVELVQGRHTGFSVGVFARNQVSFPNGQFVDNAFVLVGVRWAGIGRFVEPYAAPVVAPQPPGPVYPMAPPEPPLPPPSQDGVNPLPPPEVRAPWVPPVSPPTQPIAPSTPPLAPVPPPVQEPPVTPSAPVAPICAEVRDALRNGQLPSLPALQQCFSDALDEVALAAQDHYGSPDACVSGIGNDTQALVDVIKFVWRFLPDEIVDIPAVWIMKYCMTEDVPICNQVREFLFTRGVGIVCNAERAERARVRHGNSP